MKFHWLRRREQDLEKELRAHLDLEAEELERDGARAQAARDTARRAFGNETLVKETVREAWGWAWVERLRQDVGYGLRVMRKSPLFTLVAVLTLALGIGANTAIFSLMNEVLFRILPVNHPEQLERLGGTEGYFSFPMYRELRDANQVFSGLAARHASPVSLLSNGRTERGVAEIVSGNYFSVLGVPPLTGRVLTDADDQTVMGAAVTVLSFRYWRQAFGADPGVVGKTLRINNYPFTVIGVAPPSFEGIEVGSVPDLWVPLTTLPQIVYRGYAITDTLENTGNRFLELIGRRRPDMTESQARAGINLTFHQAIRDGHHKQYRQRQAEAFLDLVPGGKGFSRVRADFENPLYLLSTVVALVLLIACANLANLLLARSTARRKEIAVRLALGAGRVRLIRQLLTESVLLSLSGGALGVVFAIWGVRVLLSFLPNGGVGTSLLPLTLTMHLDPRLAGFAFVLAVATGLLFGLAPAIQATRSDVSASLKDEGNGLGMARRRFELGKFLVVSQVAMSLLLLVGAGLFLRSLKNVVAINVGLSTEKVLVASMNPELNGYTSAQISNFYQELRRRLEAQPGVQAVGMVDVPLLSGGPSGGGFRPHGIHGIVDHVDKVSGDFFRATGGEVIRGRDFGPQDTPTSPRVAIISESTAREFYPSEEPLGQKVWIARIDDVEIIGIARDSKYGSVREQTPRNVYMSFDQDAKSEGERTLYIRTSGDPAAMIFTLRREVQGLDYNLPLYDVKTFAEQKAESLLRERLVALLSTFFGLLALLLASVGLYGVLAYTVQRRTREIGIRMALGAKRSSVIWMVLRECLTLVGIGILGGLLLSAWLAKLVVAQLYGVTPRDPATLLATTVLLTAVALLAGYLPARRASRVDPLVALRYE